MRRASVILVGLLALAAIAASANAAEVSRDSYREAAEPICKANTVANERILSGVRAQVKQGKLAAAGAQFTKAAKALKKTLNQLRVLPRPVADKARLAKWLAYVMEEVSLFEAAAQKLKAGDKFGAEKMVVRLTHTANLANNQVNGFEFDYCRFEPSRFT